MINIHYNIIWVVICQKIHFNQFKSIFTLRSFLSWDEQWKMMAYYIVLLTLAHTHMLQPSSFPLLSTFFITGKDRAEFKLFCIKLDKLPCIYKLTLFQCSQYNTDLGSFDMRSCFSSSWVPDSLAQRLKELRYNFPCAFRYFSWQRFLLHSSGREVKFGSSFKFHHSILVTTDKE